MMNLIARAPSHVSSSTSASPWKRSYGSQGPWSSKAKKEERSGRPDIGIDRKKAFDHYHHEQFMESFSSASYLQWDDDRAWSSQEWKTDLEIYERSVRPDESSWRTTREVRPGFLSRGNSSRRNRAIRFERGKHLVTDRGDLILILKKSHGLNNFVIGNDEAELESCVEPRSFVNRVNDQVRKRQEFHMLQKLERNIMFVTVTMESAVFMGKNYLNNCQPIVNTTHLTLKQMFDISTRLVSEKMISRLETIGWENHSW